MKRVLLLVVLLISVSNAQLLNSNKDLHLSKAPVLSNEDQIRSIVDQVVYMAQINRLDRLSRFLSTDFKAENTVNTIDSSFFPMALQIDSINVTVRGNNGTVQCSVSTDFKRHSKKEAMTFSHSSGRWKIVSSSFLVQSLLQRNTSNKYTGIVTSPRTGTAPSSISKVKAVSAQSTKLGTISSVSNTVSSFVFSNHALVGRTFTINGSDFPSINRTLTRQYLGVGLYGMLYGGTAVTLNNSNTTGVVVTTDNTWNRLVFGDQSLSWIASYGDHSGEQPIYEPSSISMDMYGNIFVLAGSPAGVIQLKYNDGSQSISFVKNVSTSGVQQAVDLFMDDNGTPNDVSDDFLWIVDKAGNAIYKFSWSGTQLGYYTSVVDGSGNSVSFYHPSKVLAEYNGGSSLAVIDNDGTRVIVIDNVTGFQGGQITGNYTSTQFSMSVSLSSLGIFGGTGSGLWVADQANQMFHIFDAYYGNGYLCSVKQLSDRVRVGTHEWFCPQTLVSTYMSNSASSYLEGWTLDQFDNVYGINKYLSGADLLNPYAAHLGTVGYGFTTINATMPTATTTFPSSPAVYKSDGTFVVQLLPAGYYASKGFVTMIQDNQLPSTLGKYRVHFWLLPYYFASYSNYNYQPTTLETDVWFALPPAGSLTGPSCGLSGNSLSFNVLMTSGSGDFSYTWYRQDFGSNSWNVVSTGSPMLAQQMGTKSFTLRCDVNDNLNGNTISVTKYISSVTTSGTLSSNEIWSVPVTLTGSVTVPSGLSLTIQPGTTVRIPSGASLTASGLLTVNGNSSSKVTFTSTGSTSPGDWGSIYLSGSGASGSTIQYANIQYGTEVDVINASNVTIQNCSITNSSMNGINFSGSTGSALNNTISNSDIYHGIIVQNGSNVTCNQNVIYKTNQNQQGAGILFSGGNGNVWQNDVDYYNWGIAAIWGSSPQFSNANNNNKNNCITNCQIGVMVYQQSYPTICPGAGAPYSYYMGNSIHNNSINVALNTWYSTVSSLSAEYVYWGGTPVSSMFAVGSGSSIDYNNWLSTDPWSGAPLPSASPAPGGSGVKTNQVAARVTAPQSDAQSPRITTNGSVGANMSNSEDSLLVGIQLREQDKYKEAKDYFVSFLRRHPDQQAAYVELYNCADSATIQDIINFFKSLPTQASNVQDLLLSYLYLKEGEVNSARDVNDEIISKNANTSLAVRAELNNFFIELYNENDPTSASSILKHLQTEANLSTPMELSLAEDALMTYVDPKTGKMPYGSYQQSAVSGQQKTNGLAQNYPNPFNPTTVISYNLRTSGRVTLKVYDVLGREVMTLVDGYQDAGVHTAEFNGENLASGVYFYRLTAPGVNQINKMLMIK